MTRILHISDTHFGTEMDDVQRALLALSHHLLPEVIVLTGDITQRARPGQFAAAATFIEALPAPVLAVPGNHDIPLFNLLRRGLRPYLHYQQAIDRELEPEFLSPTLLLLGVNSTRPRRHVDGELSMAQIRRISQRLAEASPEQLRVVALHHPVKVVEEKDRENLVRRHRKAVDAWVEAGVDLVLAGHIHLPYVCKLGEPGQRLAWTAQAGTAISHRLRDSVPNSVNLIEHECGDGAHHCTLQRWDFDASQGEFSLAHQRCLPLCRAGAH